MLQDIFSFWQSLSESTKILIAVSGLALLLLKFGHQRRKLKQDMNEAVERLSSELDAILEAVEEAKGSVVNGANLENEYRNWENIRKKWSDMRDRIQLLIDSISDGRKRRPYARMKRNSYEDILRRLRDEDKTLDTPTFEALLNMNQEFLSHRPVPHTTTDRVRRRFEQWYRTADSALPNSSERLD